MTTLRYKIDNYPVYQNEHNIDGYIDIEVNANGIPGKEFVDSSKIKEWKLSVDGSVLSSDAQNAKIVIWSQSYGNNLIATDKGLFLQGEVGSKFELTNYLPGVEPFLPFKTFRVTGFNDGTSVNKVYTEYVEGIPPNRYSYNYKWRNAYTNTEPLGFAGNVVQIANSPTVLGTDSGLSAEERLAYQRQLNRLLSRRTYLEGMIDSLGEEIMQLEDLLS